MTTFYNKMTMLYNILLQYFDKLIFSFLLSEIIATISKKGKYNFKAKKYSIPVTSVVICLHIVTFVID